jgi:methylated-DNA-[protein]-cysteine S-methyltransferase
MPRFRLDRRPSPIGEMLLLTDADGNVRALDFPEFEAKMLRLLRRQYREDVTLAPGPAPPAVTRALDAYLAGELAAIDAIPVATGGTEFQRAVWNALRTIPVGTTTTYGTLAKQLGHPTAVRAVGAANGANPVPIVVPCHRVIGANAR